MNVYSSSAIIGLSLLNSILMARFLKQSFAQTCLKETDNGKLQHFNYSRSLITNRGTVERGKIHSACAMKGKWHTCWSIDRFSEYHQQCSNDSLALVFSSRPIKMSSRFVLGRENVPCVAVVVNRSLKADCTDFTRKMRMVPRSWQNCLEGPQNCPQGRGFVYFLPRGRNFAKIFCPGAGNLTTLKNSPGVSPGGMLVLGNWLMRNAKNAIYRFSGSPLVSDLERLK